MTDPIIEGLGNLPERPSLIYINRADLRVVQALEKVLGRILWLVDASCMPGRSVMGYLIARRAMGFQGNMDSISPELMADRIHDWHKAGCHVVLLTGHPTQARASLCDVPTRLLNYLDDSTLPVLPIYAGYHQADVERALEPSAPPPAQAPAAEQGAAAPALPPDTEAPPVLRILPQLRAGKGMGARVRSAWMEAAADHVAAHPLLKTATLPRLLVTALMRHQDEVLCDGVDDSRLTYGKLLTLALVLSRRLSNQTQDKRLGIILPPGKRAAIANLACLLAGISPVNIDYSLGRAAVQHQIRRAGLNRFVTEKRFHLKLDRFAWPSSRDLFFMDEELLEAGRAHQTYWRALVRLGKPGYLLRCLNPPAATPESEATLFFTAGVENEPQAVTVSHRMLLASLLQLQSRLDMQPGQRVLSALPWYRGCGFACGLLFPLLFGYGMVTYPDPDSGIRLATIMAETQVRLAFMTPGMAQSLLSLADADNRKRLNATAPALAAALQGGRLAELFAHLHYLIAAGAPLSEALVQKARELFNLQLLSAYTLAEAAPMAALNMPPCEGGQEDAEGMRPPTIPAFRAGSAGAPLPGMAVRITDVGKEGRLLPPGVPGLIWLKGANLAERYLDAEESLLQSRWYYTGDVGHLDADGLLHIAGRRMRFSHIGGVLVPHERLEAVMAAMYKIPHGEGLPQRLAIVAVQDPREGEQLVLLSAAHRKNAEYRFTTMRYNIMNAGFPEQWTPKRLVSLEYLIPLLPPGSAPDRLPTLPDGKLDYLRCFTLLCRVLGIALPNDGETGE